MLFLEYPLKVADRLTAWLLAIMLAVITLVLFVNASARYFAGISITGGEELARCLMVWMTFMGSYLLVRVQGHVSIDLVMRALGDRPRLVLFSLISLLGIAVCSYFAVLGYNLTSYIFSTGQRMSSLPFARGWFYVPVPLGCGLMALAFLQGLIARITGLGQPSAADFTLPSAEDDAVAEATALRGEK